VFNRLIARCWRCFCCRAAAAQTKITIAVGGGRLPVLSPDVLAKQLGEYDQAGLASNWSI